MSTRFVRTATRRRRILPLAMGLAAVAALVAGCATSTPPTDQEPTPVPAAKSAASLHAIDEWSFDEGNGTSAAEKLGSVKRPITLENGASWTAGVSGKALAFNGHGQFATAKRPVVKTSGADYSVSAWVRLAVEPGGSFQTFVSRDGPQNSDFYLQYVGQQKMFAFSAFTARALAPKVGTPKAKRWYFLTGVRDHKAGTLAIYVNGVFGGSVRAPKDNPPGLGAFVVGRGKSSGSPADFVDGDVDDVTVFDHALTSTQVAALFNAGPSIH